MVTFDELPELKPFPKEITEDTPDGKYTISSLAPVELEAYGPDYEYSVWFKTPVRLRLPRPRLCYSTANINIVVAHPNDRPKASRNSVIRRVP